MSCPNPPDDLLDVLARRIGLSCLSDLCNTSCRSQLLQVLSDLSPGDFPLCQWNEAISYLLRNDMACSSPAQAKTHLLAYLNTQ